MEQQNSQLQQKLQLQQNNADNGEVFIESLADEIKISVRSLVEFILRSGDIDNRHVRGADNAMQEGSRIHRMIQKRMDSDYQAEVPLKFTHVTDNYTLTVEGRADGIIDKDGSITIDEIKGTYRDLSRMKKPVDVHVAQAKCYAYMYGVRQNVKYISVRMTYCNIETEDIRYFYEDYTFEELEKWFIWLIDSYKKWADYNYEWREVRQASINTLQFPFEYRDGQKELVTYVYQTIFHSKKLFLEAPTGVGKTISTVFPAIKAMGKGMGDKLFYLTAKTITRTVAEDTFSLLRDKGLRFKSVVITAKDKICFLDKPMCNPESCPYAKGHYDRINDAIYDLLISRESFSREAIEEYAVKHQVCPFELCLDLSLFSDAVIGDYNYLFDPHVYLKRFFGDGMSNNYLFLIDEAHNLLERGREMYSAPLIKEDFLELKRELKETVMSEIENNCRKNGVLGQMTFELTAEDTVLSETDSPTRSTEDDYGTLYIKGMKTKEYSGKSLLIRRGYAEKIDHYLDKCNKELLALKRQCDSYMLVENIDPFVKQLMRLHATIDEYLDEQEEEKLDIRDSLLDFFFEISHFLEIYEELDSNYVKYTQITEDNTFMIKLFCVNPAQNLKRCMKRGRSSILFSATFLPIQYYKKLLGGEEDDYEVYAKSVFDNEKRALFIAGDVTSKYTRRTEKEFDKMARYIYEVVKRREGNYMVFCPSYSFMQTVYSVFIEEYCEENMECIIQSEYMNEQDREEFLAKFSASADVDFDGLINIDIETENESTLIAFCVLGGIFGEGIDLKNDSLIGALIIGTGLPQICCEREILKFYFDENGENGYDYSYRYPGMNKVLQAAGRVIRTADDIGVVALLDERFMQMSYRRMFPREWVDYEIVDIDRIGERVENFWNAWL